MTVVLSAILSGCYSGYPVDQNLWVSDIKTLPAQYEDNTIILRGETKMEKGHLYFILSQSENFDYFEDYQIEAQGDYDEKSKYADINKWSHIGTWYYKLIARYGEDVYDKSNVESFTVENPLRMLDPVDVTWKQATLRATTSVNPDANGSAYYSYFYIYGDNYSSKVDAKSYVNDTEGIWEYRATVANLSYSSEYTVTFIQRIDGIEVTSEPITFSTTPRTTAPLGIGSIKGSQPNLSGNFESITDPLKVIVYDSEEGYVTEKPLIAIYDPAVGYKWADGSEYTLVDGHYYSVAIFKADGTNWQPDGGYSGFISYNDDYAYGADQTPIYFGNCWKLSIDNPNIKADLQVKTSQISVVYPAIWGQTSFELVDENKKLPSSRYGLEEVTMYGPANTTSTYRGVANPLVTGNTLECTFNIWPINYKAGQLMIRATNGNQSVQIPCPVSLNTQAGKRYVFEFEGFSISDIYVSKWEVFEDGDVIIIKQQH